MVVAFVLIACYFVFWRNDAPFDSEHREAVLKGALGYAGYGGDVAATTKGNVPTSVIEPQVPTSVVEEPVTSSKSNGGETFSTASAEEVVATGATSKLPKEFEQEYATLGK